MLNFRNRFAIILSVHKTIRLELKQQKIKKKNISLTYKFWKNVIQ